jgi:hypothetical protein
LLNVFHKQPIINPVTQKMFSVNLPVHFINNEQEGFEMSKYYILGGLLCLGGLVLVIFQAISSMMAPGDIVWKSVSIVDVLGATHLQWIDGISWHSIQKNLKHITTMPMYILLLGTGAFTMVVGGVVDK